jgi:hypothetical protein
MRTKVNRVYTLEIVVALTIKTNFPDVARGIENITSDLRDKVLSSAINKTLEQARTQMVRAVAGRYNLKAGDVRDELVIERARPVPGKVEGALLAKGKRSRNLIRFVERLVTLAAHRKRMRAGDTELRFKIKRSGKTTLPGAFIGNKGRTVFMRVPGSVARSRAKDAGTQHGEAIKGVATIYVPSMFNQRQINAAVLQFAEAKLPEVFEREARYRMARVV